jgi:hypothetical protein
MLPRSAVCQLMLMAARKLQFHQPLEADARQQDQECDLR